ncbi:MAG: polysaccharide deacetylase family protein [Candidatus Marinimicrobia bacterium]|nr:polysaccharide deacetylase family protein [Candidatus Neomarinimicrobiota bacterium]
MSSGKNKFTTDRKVSSSTALVSIHDVMPKTLPEIKTILHLLNNNGIQSVTLLIIPGKDWSKSDLNILRELQHQGYILAGHGWNHQCFQNMSLKHKIHSALISRMEAEHLSLSGELITALIRQCFSWFQENDFIVPDLYVPPAWALGSISWNDLEEMPFNMYETLTGVYHSSIHSFYRLPLVGFEADTSLRIRAIKALNTLNRGLSYILGRPLRIAIHPYDLHWGLAANLKKQLSRNCVYINYSDLDFKYSNRKRN